jgi:2-polyprenyl-3-methyl-5-hydroxy-6-metoxy-1,4-benzoquinol methylase
MMVNGETLSARWYEALVLPGEQCLIESSVRELTEYFGISRLDALESCVAAQTEAQREWEAEPRDSVHEVEAFYRLTRSNLFENLWSHATEPAAHAANVALLDYAQQIGALEYLDFGAGVGSTAILFAQHGFKVTLAEISPLALAFARWRLQRRGLSAEFIDLNHQPLPRERYAFVTAVNVLEHLFDPAVEVQPISAALVENGVFAFNLPAGDEPRRQPHAARRSFARCVWLACAGCQDTARWPSRYGRASFTSPNACRTAASGIGATAQ